MQISASQELVALGTLNIVGSFFRSYPVTGSFSRTAVNSSCNVKSQLASVLAGGIVILSFETLTHCFTYIPKATLSALVIVALSSIIEYKVWIIAHVML